VDAAQVLKENSLEGWEEAAIGSLKSLGRSSIRSTGRPEQNFAMANRLPRC
jgi:hypothetical protein